MGAGVAARRESEGVSRCHRPGECQNLPGLDQAAAYGNRAAQLLPTSGQVLARRAAHVASGVRFSLDQPEAMRRLHAVTGGLRGLCSLGSLLPQVLDGALSLTGADFGMTMAARSSPSGGWRTILVLANLRR
jgi:hypothetical protein